ncbi:hypothetical protein MOQ15_21295, partial [Stenotrophomonas maltophilia]|uniref:hypothetical protein n=1 Tax=Stenotrophomonas maltophilia TaxID=40324 RepID=UPI001F53C0DF
PPMIQPGLGRPVAGNLAMPPKIMRVPASGRHYRITHALLRQAMSGGRERVAAAVYGEPPKIETR